MYVYCGVFFMKIVYKLKKKTRLSQLETKTNVYNGLNVWSANLGEETLTIKFPLVMCMKNKTCNVAMLRTYESGGVYSHQGLLWWYVHSHARIDGDLRNKTTFLANGTLFNEV